MDWVEIRRRGIEGSDWLRYLANLGKVESKPKLVIRAPKFGRFKYEMRVKILDLDRPISGLGD